MSLPGAAVEGNYNLKLQSDKYQCWLRKYEQEDSPRCGHLCDVYVCPSPLASSLNQAKYVNVI